VDTSLIRILVVDDYEPWRRFIVTTLQTQPEFAIIGQVSDGLEAVQQAQELQPDLVLLDIGLPTLNGIEVARRIREVAPTSRILFVTENRSPDIAEEALSTGACGYMVKSDAASELLPATRAVLEGKRFVSSTLRSHKFTDISAANAPHRHELLFFSDDAVLLDRFTRFVAAALKGDNAAIAVVTKSHRESLRQRLKADRVDIDRAIQQGTFILLDVADTLAALLVDGSLDPVRFLEDFSRLILKASKAAKAEYPRVSFCGECIGHLWAEGETDAALRLEQGCNELAKTHDVDLLCAYPLRELRDEDEDLINSIYAEHSVASSQ
jgi:DNA-binding NarL/FixJ family response regulator